MPRSRAVIAIALAVALGSALPLQGGDESARAEVGSATGPLVATSDGGALLVAQGLRPGDTRAGEVTVINAGDTAGAFTLAQADRLDSPTAAGPLSGVLDLTVTDLTTGRALYVGKLGAMPGVALGDFAQGDAHRYRFAVSFPVGAPAFDNQFQVASTTVGYVWSAGPVAPAPAAPVSAPPSTAPTVTLGSASRPTARLVAAPRQHGRTVRLRLTCDAPCRARFTATARVGRASVRVKAVARTLRRPGGVTVRLALPRRTRAAVAGGRSATVRARVQVTIAGRTLMLQKTVRLAGKPATGRH